MRNNGLPPPLERLIVDTSRNPGRRVLRQGYVEAIGHRMWLSAEFFRRVPDSSQDRLLASNLVEVSERSDGLISVLANHEPFRDDSTAEKQSELRGLLFPTAGS